MFSTDTWLKIFCSGITNSVLFGTGAVTVLSIPALAADAKYWLPIVVIASFGLSPPVAGLVASRMRIRNWGRRRWREGDAISG